MVFHYAFLKSTSFLIDLVQCKQANKIEPAHFLQKKVYSMKSA